jgi:hypothetical protein
LLVSRPIVGLDEFHWHLQKDIDEAIEKPSAFLVINKEKGTASGRRTRNTPWRSTARSKRKK